MRTCESSSVMGLLNDPVKKRSPDSITSAEYTLLSNIVSSLGTYVVNRRKTTFASTRTCKKKAKEEAELFLNFISKASEVVVSEPTTVHSNVPDDSSTIPSDSSVEEHFPYYISPSLSFESNKVVLGINDTSSNLTVNDDSQLNISMSDKQQVHSQISSATVSIPSLSLINQVIDILPTSSQSTDHIIIHDGSCPVSIAIAENIIDSVNVAIESRIKTWVKTLSKKASVKYESRVNEVKKAFVNGSTNHKSLQSDLHDIKDLLKASTEAKVINALANVASMISVHDIRTTFHILEQLKDTGNVDALIQMPRSKKMRSVSDESNSTQNGESSIQISYAILLDVKCNIHADSFQTTSLTVETSGEIHGFFTRVKSELHINNIIVNLDTDALANAIERESRRTICSYAVESMAGQHFTYCTIHDTIQSQFMQHGAFVIPSNDSSDNVAMDSEERSEGGEHSITTVVESVNKDRVTPKLDMSDKILLTHKPSESIMVTPVTAGVQHEDVTTKVMPPPPPRLPLDENALPRSSLFLHPRRISPSVDLNSNIDSISMISPGTSTSKESSSGIDSRSLFTNGHPIRAAPSLVSPDKSMVKGSYPVLNKNFQHPILPTFSTFSFPVDGYIFGRRE